MIRSPHLARLAALLTVLAAQSFAADGHTRDPAETVAAEAHHGADHAFEAGGFKVVHPWMNATDGREALIFLELANTGDTRVTLDGAEIPFAETAALVGFALERGEATYQPLPSVPVQPGRSLTLAPQGLALRATGLATGFSEGDTAAITLLTSAGPIPVTVAVEAADARHHSHAGHAH
ncbi:Copper(I)-binding protein [Roseivivax lentus]|uniref:Copper(I)-binding protein n=1 Tax=Roseivivax lentus TaxID=633194 RepID=A0A1N7KCE8_9RHOB|nr:copper chaperone PCu(A)C [Roseivivax lentus]SIS59275.1 Copper(I)-binding protein [Roseivivax lentus]